MRIALAEGGLACIEGMVREEWEQRFDRKEKLTLLPVAIAAKSTKTQCMERNPGQLRAGKGAVGRPMSLHVAPVTGNSNPHHPPLPFKRHELIKLLSQVEGYTDTPDTLKCSIGLRKVSQRVESYRGEERCKSTLARIVRKWGKVSFFVQADELHNNSTWTQNLLPKSEIL